MTFYFHRDTDRQTFKCFTILSHESAKLSQICIYYYSGYSVVCHMNVSIVGKIFISVFLLSGATPRCQLRTGEHGC